MCPFPQKTTEPAKTAFSAQPHKFCTVLILYLEYVAEESLARLTSDRRKEVGQIAGDSGGGGGGGGRARKSDCAESSSSSPD